MTRKVELSYFAVLRERAGKSHESRETMAKTLAELYEELRAEYQFPVDASRIRAAIGDNYVDLDQDLAEGLRITFIPPVAGG
jgi:molybdopterin synthase sulfur carrier subunit